jgi:hypothetical protein
VCFNAWHSFSSARNGDGCGNETHLALSGDTLPKTLLANKSIQVQFHAIQSKKPSAGVPLALAYYDEVYLVHEVSITIDGESFWVLSSAFADAFNARAALLKIEKGKFSSHNLVVLMFPGAPRRIWSSTQMRW